MDLVALYRLLVAMSIAMVQLPKVVAIFCALTMLEPTIVQPMTAARELVAVPPL